MISDANVATLEEWAANWDGMEGPAQLTLALIADWRKRGEALRIAEQMALEVESAIYRGPGWYTKGEAGMTSQVLMWLKKTHDAIAALTPQQPPQASEK